MAKFELAINEVLEVEGGYVNHPADRGGPTNFGITLAALAAYRGKSVTANDVKNMTLTEAKAIYQKNYWDIIRLSEIESQLIADLVFDQSVNRGPTTAAKNLQESYNLVHKTHLVVDGKIGPASIAAINEADEIKLAASFLKDAQLDYATIVANKPNQSVFIRGWINRTHKLFDKIINYKVIQTPVYEPPKESNSILNIIVAFIESLYSKPKEETKETIFDKIVKNNPGINQIGLTRALQFLPKVERKDVMIFVDYNIRDTSKRLYYIDLDDGTATMHLSSHGKNSDPDRDGIATEFSNVSGSNKSSLGAMKTGVLYGKSVGGGSKFQHSARLHGLEVGLNDNVLDRSIVFHNANYTSTGGDSLGCITLTNEDAPKIIPYIGNGVLVYAHHNSLNQKSA